MSMEIPAKRPAMDDSIEPQAKRLALQQPGIAGPSSGVVPLLVPKTEPGVVKPIDRVHTDSVLNFLLRLACQVSIYKENYKRSLKMFYT